MSSSNATENQYPYPSQQVQVVAYQYIPPQYHHYPNYGAYAQYAQYQYQQQQYEQYQQYIQYNQQCQPQNQNQTVNQDGSNQQNTAVVAENFPHPTFLDCCRGRIHPVTGKQTVSEDERRWCFGVPTLDGNHIKCFNCGKHMGLNTVYGVPKRF